MGDNKLLQTVLLLSGAVALMTLVKSVSPTLELLLTVFAGFVAAVIWMSEYSRAALFSLYQIPGLHHLILCACKVSGLQAPVDPAASQKSADGTVVQAKAGEPEESKLLLHSNGDFASATRQLKELIKGHNDVLEALLDQLRLNVQLRDNTAPQVTLPPIGVFVLIGKSGLGKKLLATEVGYRLYKGSSVCLLDVSDPGLRGSILINEAREHPHTTFVLENFQNCSTAMQEDLLSIVSGVPQVDAKSGAKVSFRHCFFFFLVHRDAANMERPKKKGAGTGQTVVVTGLTERMPLDQRLAWSLHGIYPFVLPGQMDQAEVVAMVIQNECRKYNLSLGRVDASILAHEVKVISQHGGFELTPARVTKLMHNRLAQAVANKEQLIDLEAEPRAQAQQRSY